MNQMFRPKSSPLRVAATACPHDCPSTCALEVDVLDENTIGRVRGARDNSYTAGVICAKVARYAERIHHPDRLTRPLVRTGAKGSGTFAPISWDEALDLVAEKFNEAEARYGSEAIWPYQYAGTMGLVMRDGIHRLRHAKNIPDSIPPSASIRHGPVSSQARVCLPVPIRAKWQSPIAW
jgi:anaerobic selenocysteine-containing dehydrogenase